MGGCATKPKVTKDGGVDVKAPEPEQVKEDTVETKVEAEKQEQLLQSGPNLDVNEIVDDDQANKRRSLSLLFNKENEDTITKVSTQNEKNKAEETVKEETLETEKPLEDAKNIEPTLKHESPKTEEKPTQETKNNEPSTEQESTVIKVDVEEKPSLQNQITDPAAEEIVKTETPEEAKKTSQETSKINEPAEETVVKQNQNDIAAEVTVVKTETQEGEKASEETKSNELNEPIKLEKSSETILIENVVVPPPAEKVIEVVLTNAESVENKIVEPTSSIEEKNHVEHISKASDADSEKASIS